MVLKSPPFNPNAGGGAGLTVTAVTSGFPYTAGTTSGVFTIYNSTGAGVTFNLPAAPSANQIVVVVDAGLTSGAHAITIQGNGNTICANGATAASTQLNQNGASATFAWDGTQWTQYA